MLESLPEWVPNVVYPVDRWLHIVCTTLLVGGVLFYEFVVPAAIEDLPEAQQFAVLGRVRWVFRRIVVMSVLLLLLSGIVSMYRMWHLSYSLESASPIKGAAQYHPSMPWVVAHIVLGVIAMLICWRLTTSRRMPNQPLMWLRLSLIILLVSIFVADVARHIRLSLRERHDLEEQRAAKVDEERSRKPIRFMLPASHDLFPSTREVLPSTQPVSP